MSRPRDHWRSWWCRHGLHRWGWSGYHDPCGKLYCCERDGCTAERWSQR